MPIVCDPKMSAADNLRSLVAAATDGARQSSYSFGCLMGNLSAELSSEHEDIRTTLPEIFRDWALTFETVIGAGQKAGGLNTAIAASSGCTILIERS